MITYAALDTPIGRLLMAKAGGGVCKINLPSKHDSSFFHWLKDHFPEEKIIEDADSLSVEINQLQQYFDGKRSEFTFSFDLRTTPFRNKALEKVAKIPFGKTASYKDIAVQINNKKAVRAVGSANAWNPIPIVIPCHRVIAHDGSLGGYGGGLTMKKWLLKHENCL